MGKEEFLIICPENDLKSAKQLADKIREIIEQHNFPSFGCVTCSFGISIFHYGDS
ncbi:diguanylate cyclase domain-containing protein [Psychromonas ingrahamii]|uniref:diguanylate cyclase domain-containing protein n=1 Tax=Psychromonas ingrahamii TaxID=357794 RepID=UPI0000D7FFE4